MNVQVWRWGCRCWVGQVLGGAGVGGAGVEVQVQVNV